MGTLGRDFGKTISSDDAEVELYSIHDFESYFPDLFVKRRIYKNICRQDNAVMGMETFRDELFGGMRYRKSTHLRMNLLLRTIHFPLEALPIT